MSNHQTSQTVPPQKTVIIIMPNDWLAAKLMRIRTVPVVHVVLYEDKVNICARMFYTTGAR